MVRLARLVGLKNPICGKCGKDWPDCGCLSTLFKEIVGIEEEFMTDRDKALRDRFDRAADDTPSTPHCFGVYRSPQSDAENCCNDCLVSAACYAVFNMQPKGDLKMTETTKTPNYQLLEARVRLGQHVAGTLIQAMSDTGTDFKVIAEAIGMSSTTLLPWFNKLIEGKPSRSAEDLEIIADIATSMDCYVRFNLVKIPQ